MTGSRSRFLADSIVICFLMAAISACVLVRDPSGSGATTLLGSEDIRPDSEWSFLLSPNDRFIFYQSNRGEVLRPVFAIYDLEEQRSRDIEWSTPAAEMAAVGRGPRLSTGRWDELGSAIILRGDAHFFIVRVDQPALEWELAREVDEFRLVKPLTSGHDPDVLLRQSSEREVLLVDAADPDRILARHHVDEIGGTRVVIPHWTVSPNRQYVTYVVESHRGTFLGPTRAYILALAADKPSRPRLLAAPVYGPLIWKADNSAFFACVRPEGETPRLYRWSSPF